MEETDTTKDFSEIAEEKIIENFISKTWNIDTTFGRLCMSTINAYLQAVKFNKEVDETLKKGHDSDLIAQRKNIMTSVLWLMLYTDADDVFLDIPEKMKEYDLLLLRFLGMRPPSHE